MYVRRDVRYNCFRMKNGVAPKNQEIIDIIEKQRGNFEWSKFAIDWDVAVTPNQIKVMPSIKDINKVTEICTYKYIAAKKGIEMDRLSDEEEAIVEMIEAQFLEGKMTWANYRERWGIRWENERNRIETYLTNIPSGQIDVTEEMIRAVFERGQSAAETVLGEVRVIIKDTKEE